jgi:high-affinity iron transporter
VLNALKKGNGQLALKWLPLREFRVATKFSRPGADATRALQAFIVGQQSAVDAAQAIQIDLLDTYQSRLDATLADVDQAAGRQFTLRQAEEAGLAAGYFEILAETYDDQRGHIALLDARIAFTALTTAQTASDLQNARASITAALKGFRAAPLSEADQARRAGQLLRYLTLVPVEYGRGVRNGVVVKDIEIQEALTFRDGAAAAFADLQITLEGRDASATSQIADQFKRLEGQIRSTANPDVIQKTVDDLNRRLTQLMPDKWQTVNNDSDVDVINAILSQVELAATQGQYTLAESARLEAYALLELGIEQRLRGFAPDKAAAIESLFWQGSSNQPGLSVLIGSQAPADAIKVGVKDLKIALADAQTFLNSAKSAPQAVAGNAGIIVFREGLEAVLILASLLASLRTIEERKYRRPILIGALLAFFATGLTWWFANQLLISMMRLGERLEAIVSLIAIGVLLLITNWFFHKVYWTGWMANFHNQKRRLIGGVAVIAISQSVGLVILGFTSIYREGFETVLFLQSLVLEAGIGIVLQGVALGLVGVGIVGAITFSLQVKLPYKKMLVVTGVFIGVVLLTMVGNTVHVMQSVGWLPITPIQGFYIPFWMGQWFGLFATWQGIGLQLLSAVFVIGSYFWAERINHQKRVSKTTKLLQGEPILDSPRPG